MNDKAIHNYDLLIQITFNEIYQKEFKIKKTLKTGYGVSGKRTFKQNTGRPKAI